MEGSQNVVCLSFMVINEEYLDFWLDKKLQFEDVPLNSEKF